MPEVVISASISVLPCTTKLLIFETAPSKSVAPINDKLLLPPEMVEAKLIILPVNWTVSAEPDNVTAPV